MAYFVVFYRVGRSTWLLADEQTIPNSYESFPVMYQRKERAERAAAEFAKEYKPFGDSRCETKVVEVTVTPPEN